MFSKKAYHVSLIMFFLVNNFFLLHSSTIPNIKLAILTEENKKFLMQRSFMLKIPDTEDSKLIFYRQDQKNVFRSSSVENILYKDNGNKIIKQKIGYTNIDNKNMYNYAFLTKTSLEFILTRFDPQENGITMAQIGDTCSALNNITLKLNNEEKDVLEKKIADIFYSSIKSMINTESKNTFLTAQKSFIDQINSIYLEHIQRNLEDQLINKNYPLVFLRPENIYKTVENEENPLHNLLYGFFLILPRFLNIIFKEASARIEYKKDLISIIINSLILPISKKDQFCYIQKAIVRSNIAQELNPLEIPFLIPDRFLPIDNNPSKTLSIKDITDFYDHIIKKIVEPSPSFASTDTIKQIIKEKENEMNNIIMSSTGTILFFILICFKKGQLHPLFYISIAIILLTFGYDYYDCMQQLNQLEKPKMFNLLKSTVEELKKETDNKS